VYDGGGVLAAEYSTAAQAATPTTSYLTTDHLGSPRVITDKQGNVISRRDFMPFGEEIGANVGERNEAQKYSNVGADNIRQRFTGYEKDTETQLDFAEARMYQNKHGRFTAVDPLMASANPGNPQTFNLYIYVNNNPLNLTDPSGLDPCDLNTGVGCPTTQGSSIIQNPCYVSAGCTRINLAEVQSEGVRDVPVEETTSGTVSSNISPIPLPSSMPTGSGNAGTTTDPLFAGTGGGEGNGIDYLPTIVSPDPEDNPVIDLLDATQIGLGVVGQIPVVGEIADGIDTGISLLREDYTGAALGAASMIPFAGNVAGVTKIARKLDNLTDLASTIARRGPSIDPNAPHNKMIRETAERITDGVVIAGGGIKPEKLIPTPGGFKSGRRPDILVQRPDGTKYGINVGKQGKYKTPIKREAQAIWDLEGAGVEMYF
jgi:RHS repeat-associated protein